MREKKHKYLEDLLDEYIQLTDEQVEIPILIEKAQKKFDQHLSEDKEATYKSSDAEDLFKHFNQVRKHQERKQELIDEIAEAENSLKEFLLTLQGGKVSYERKDDNDKSKNTFVFSLEGNELKSNR